MALTTGKWAPASRFRVRELIPYLARQGVDLTEKIPLIPAYPPRNYLLRPPWLAAAILARIPAAIMSRKADVIFFQRELVSTLLTLEPFFKKPKVLDVDDAIHLSQRFKSVERLAGQCDMVICGNTYLAEKFSQWNQNIRILPTGVDTHRYQKRAVQKVDDAQTIGWIGTSSNLHYLLDIETALAKVLEVKKNVRLVIVSDQAPAFKLIDSKRVQFVKWAADIEPELINSFSIGIMPLTDGEWARGKCSFKLLQYYACGIPAVVSPVGMNAEVVAQADAALAASSQKDWVDSLILLLDDRVEAERRGMQGRHLVENIYSLDTIAPRLASYFRELV